MSHKTECKVTNFCRIYQISKNIILRNLNLGRDFSMLLHRKASRPRVEALDTYPSVATRRRGVNCMPCLQPNKQT